MSRARISKETIDEINKLLEQGISRKEVAEKLNVSYGKVCRLTHKQKLIITSIELAELEKEYQTETLDNLSKKYERTISEMKRLFGLLGWKLHKESPKSKMTNIESLNCSSSSLVTSNYNQLLRMSADSIKEKLRKQYENSK